MTGTTGLADMFLESVVEHRPRQGASISVMISWFNGAVPMRGPL
jgi:hypothetical protein